MVFAFIGVTDYVPQRLNEVCPRDVGASCKRRRFILGSSEIERVPAIGNATGVRDQRHHVLRATFQVRRAFHDDWFAHAAASLRSPASKLTRGA